MANIVAPLLGTGGSAPDSQAVLSGSVLGVVIPVDARLQIAAPAFFDLIFISENGMHVWQATIVDASGNIQPGATVEVRDADTLALVAIYSDFDGENLRANPFTVGDDAFAQFYVETGRYRVRAFFGAAQQTWNDVELGVTLASLPDITSLVESITSDMVADEVAEQLADALSGVTSLPQQGIYHGYVKAGVTGSLFSDPTWTVSNVGAGQYRIVHNKGLSDPYSMRVVPTAISGEDRYANVAPSQQTADHFEVHILDVGGFGANNDFFFVAANAEEAETT